MAGLKLLRRIYKDDHELDQQLQSKIIETYDSFINFCIGTVEYYSMGGISEFILLV